jgi:rare lipoprotein A
VVASSCGLLELCRGTTLVGSIVLLGIVAVKRTVAAIVGLALTAFPCRAEDGLASYYGGRSHRGEMTCAHRTRPFGSMVTVTYGQHSVQCRINDRGPFVRGRVIDLSRGAARALGMLSAGIVRVSVE